MPYKSKASKIAAAQRRFTYIQAKEDRLFSYDKKAKKKQSKTDGQGENTISDKLYLKGDLLKIIITCAVIISLQILLSLTLF